MNDSHCCHRYSAIVAATLRVFSARALGEKWPALPPSDGTAMLPAQEWPLRPGPRHIKAYLYYPAGSIDNVRPTTGLMLSLHNWGGTAAVGTADPKFLADRYDVVAICVDYLQSGKYEPTVPYDFGYLQALDALRALWWVFDGLEKRGKPFARDRLFATGGSGGGNVALMANKLAPRTFACVVDCSGMAKLSDDIAYGLDGESTLNAGWSRDRNSPHYLSPEAQELRFIGHPGHLRTMKTLGTLCKVIVSHGSKDNTCPITDAREMVANMKAAGIDVEGHFITEADLDGKVFKDPGHAVGDRTLIVDRFAGKYLAAGGPTAVARKTTSDFERRDENVRYATPNGVWVISYVQGFPVGRFEPSTSRTASRPFEATSVRAPANHVSDSPFQEDITDLRAERTGCNFVHLQWTSHAARHEVDYRQVGKPDWRTDMNVCSAFHSVIMLRPETDYAFRIRAVRPPRPDEDGRLLDSGMRKDPRTVIARTTAEMPKEWLGLKLWPTWHVDTFPNNTTYPCIEFFEGFLYVLEVRDGLYVSKIRPDGFKPEWTKRIIQPTGGYMGIPDMCIFQDKLYVMWNRQDNHKPGYVITKSRQWFLTYDLRTGHVGPETAIEPTKPGCGTWEGGVEVYQGKVWMMWLEVWINEEGKWRTRLVMRPLEKEEFTGSYVFDTCPSVFPYGPSVSTFNDKLILLWSDLQANEKDPEREPLYCTFFDGRNFSDSIKVHDVGQNRYAKGAQLGDAFYCVFKSNSQYPKSRYMYHDLALSRIGPDGREIRTTYWVDDVKYNSSPDMCRVGDVLYIVFGKFEHLYGLADDPAINHGAFWGKITP